MIIYTKSIFFKQFKKQINYFPHHNIDAYRKSDIINCYNIFKNEIDNTITHHFRTNNEIQRIIYHLYSLYLKHGKIKFSATSFLFFKKVDSVCYSPLNKKIEKKLKKYKPKLLCINDNEETTNEDRLYAKQVLEKLFPNKSEFEL